MLHGDGLVSFRPASAVAFGAFALVAGVLQILATAALGRARVDAVARAAADGAGLYLLGAVATAIGLLAVWLLRRRPLVAVITFLVWQLAVYWPLLRRTSMLGLSYHGEYILHHFAALISAAACVTVLRSWSRRAELGRARWIPVVIGVSASMALVVLHVISQPSIVLRAPPAVQQVSTAALFVSAIAGLAICWRNLRPNMRLVVGLLLVPLLLRVALAFPDGLTGAPVPMWGRWLVMTSIVIAATGTFIAFRPRVTPPLRITLVVVSALVTAILYILYRRGFGELEDDVGGLAQSLFGFPLPYPNYVSDAQIFICMVAIFFILNVVYTSLVSSHDRHRGVALGLLGVTGLGLTNAQLGLMAGAGLLLLIDTSTDDEDETQSTAVPPPAPVDEILLATAERLGLPQPVALADAPKTVVALRGEVSSMQVDIRARRVGRDAWELDVRIGVLGRGRPRVELVPDAGQAGQRPAHEIGATHRIRGSARELEQLGDVVLDAMMPFPRARARFWEAGTSIALGDDLEQLEPGRLARLVVRVARSLR
jgi:hypothetical protein